jgi:hypothetical protein
MFKRNFYTFSEAAKLLDTEVEALRQAAANGVVTLYARLRHCFDNYRIGDLCELPASAAYENWINENWTIRSVMVRSNDKPAESRDIKISISVLWSDLVIKHQDIEFIQEQLRNDYKTRLKQRVLALRELINSKHLTSESDTNKHLTETVVILQQQLEETEKELTALTLSEQSGISDELTAKSKGTMLSVIHALFEIAKKPDQSSIVTKTEQIGRGVSKSAISNYLSDNSWKN